MHEQHEFRPETTIDDCESQALTTGQTVNAISPSTVQVAVGTWQR